MKDGLPQGDAAMVSGIEAEAAAPHYLKAVEAAPLGIVCVNGAKGRYTFANETFARMIGRTREQVLASDPFQIADEATHPDDRLMSRQAIARIAQGETDHVRYEKRLLRSDGSELWVTTDLVATRDSEGRLAHLTLYFIDVDARRSAELARERLEEQLRQAQKLEALGRLAGGVAHDFNNRLMVIMGYAELVNDALPRASPLAAHTAEILESAERATELTRQLLAYCRRQVLKPQILDVNAVVERMRRMLSRLIGDDITLETDLSASHSISADPGQLEQSIINLALNARDAMPKGGRLTLHTHDAVLEEGQLGLTAGDYVVLRVSDTGTGIPDDVLPRIFEPFFTTKEMGRGTGLGLATVEGIVQQSGGTIQVTSRLGQGTVFTVHLPRAQQAHAAAERRISVVPRLAVNIETVLVCDDDDSVRQLIVNILSLRGYRVLFARNGRHALEVAAQHEGPIHLLVTDLVMPDLGGMELAEKLRERNSTLCVLYISGYTEHAELLSGPLEPCTYFLAKPFFPRDLTRTVCTILERDS